MVYTGGGILSSLKKEGNSDVCCCVWMNLGDLMPSEISQT